MKQSISIQYTDQIYIYIEKHEINKRTDNTKIMIEQ